MFRYCRNNPVICKINIIFAAAMRRMWAFLLLLTLCCGHGAAVDVYSRKITAEHGLPDNNVRDLAQDSTGYLWLGTTSGLIRYDGYFFTTTKCSEAERRAFFDAYRPLKVDERARKAAQPLLTEGRTLLADNHGNGAVIDETGLLWFVDRHTGEITEMRVFDEAMMPLVSSKKYIVLTSSDEQLIWVSTNGCGLTLYDRRSATEQHIREGSGLLQTDYLVAACIDSHDNVWVADEFHGLACLSTASSDAHLIRLDEQHRTSHTNQVSLLRQLPDGRLLVANTMGDIFVADSLLRLPIFPQRHGEDIHALCPATAGGYWIGSRMHGLTTPDGHQYTHVPEDTTSLAANHVYDILCDRQGRIWVACENASLDLVETRPDGSLYFRHFLKNRSPRVLLEDSRGRLWVGTQNDGCVLLTSDSKAFPLSHPVSSLYEDRQGRIWVGTLGAGLFCITPDGKEDSALHFTTANALISDEVQSIIEDERGTLWIATRQGLTNLNPTTGDYRHHYDSHNLAANYYTAGCALRLADGRLAFGTNAGITILDPHSMPAQPAMPQLTVTDLSFDGRNTFTARFSTFDYEALATTRYSYLLEGYDRTWSEPSPYSFATYRRVPAGRYTLRIRAFAGDSSHFTELSQPINIKPAWWATWWAMLLWTLLAITATYAIYRWRRNVNHLRRRIQQYISNAAEMLRQHEILRQRLAQKTMETHQAKLPEIIVDERDRRFIDALNHFIYRHLTDEGLSVDDMATAMDLRRTVFFQKVKALTGQTPADYVKRIRMERAAQLLTSDNITVAEVCYKVGISDPHYFSKLFRQYYGISPKKYQLGERPEKEESDIAEADGSTG